MKSHLVLTVAALVPVLTYGRLGDNLDQAESRYGLPKREKAPQYAQPLLEGAKELTFEFEGWRIRCALMAATDGNEYVVREEYRKSTGTSRRIQDFELKALLDAEAGAGEWAKKKIGDLNRDPLKAFSNQLVHLTGLAGTVWTRSDGAVARLTVGDLSILLDLPHARRYEADLKTIKDQKAKASVPKF